MNGYTPSTPLKTQVANLLDQIPQEYRARAAAECMPEDGNPHDFVRHLTGYVMGSEWATYPHPVDDAEFSDGFCNERISPRDYDATPIPDMPVIDFDTVKEIPL